MAKIKLGGFEIEGETADIKDIFKDNNFDLNKYLNTNLPHNTFHVMWLIGSVLLFFVLCCCQYVDLFENKNLKYILILSLFLSLGVFTILLHLKFNNIYITGIGIGFGILIICVALGVLTPKEAAKDIKKYIPSSNMEKDK